MAKGKKKIGIDFDGFEILSSKLKELGGDMVEATESALKASHDLVTKNVTAAMRPHNKSGSTSDAIIKKPVVTWTGETAEINVGFDIDNGGLASIFLMHGTKLHGQPHIKPDKNLYNAIYGSNTKKEISKIQEEVFLKKIERVMK